MTKPFPLEPLRCTECGNLIHPDDETIIGEAPMHKKPCAENWLDRNADAIAGIDRTADDTPWAIGDRVEYTRDTGSGWGPTRGTKGEVIEIHPNDVGKPPQESQVFWVRPDDAQDLNVRFWTSPDDVRRVRSTPAEIKGKKI